MWVLENYLYLTNTVHLPKLKHEREGLHFLTRSNSERRASLSKTARSSSHSRKCKQSERTLLGRDFRVITG